MKTKNLSFALFPVGTEVQFHSTHVHGHASGIVVAYEVLRGFCWGLQGWSMLRSNDGANRAGVLQQVSAL